MCSENVSGRSAVFLLLPGPGPRRPKISIEHQKNNDFERFREKSGFDCQEPPKRPKGGLKRGARRGPGAAQERPKSRQEQPKGGEAKSDPAARRPKMTPRRDRARGPGQRGKDKRRQEQTIAAAGRDSKLTKGLPEPPSPEHLGPYPTFFSCM